MNTVAEIVMIASKLRHNFSDVSIRGTGPTAFVFAEHLGRAVEISECDGQWWTEFWDGESEEAVSEATFGSVPEAVINASNWLMKNRIPEELDSAVTV